MIRRDLDPARRALLRHLMLGVRSITLALVVPASLTLAQEPQAPEGEKPPQQDPARGRGEGPIPSHNRDNVPTERRIRLTD